MSSARDSKNITNNLPYGSLADKPAEGELIMMLHPSYVDMMDAVNSDAPEGEEIVQSRYSIVMASAKRARQIVAGDEPLAGTPDEKPLSIAVDELYEGQVHILPNVPVEQ